MSSMSHEVETNINIDKEAASMNASLDALDAALMTRGRDGSKMRADYHNQLFLHREMLFVINSPISKQEHLEKLNLIYSRMESGIKSIYLQPPHTDTQCIAALEELSRTVKPFFRTIAELSPELYDKTINKVRETLPIRINYFDALTKALPIGRYSTPLDVAWFHRTHSKLISSYLEQHPDNDLLSRPEDASTESECNFKEYKMTVVRALKQIINLCSGHTSEFFKPGDDIAENFFNYKLAEPLKAIADNNSINNIGAYVEALEKLNKSFHDQIEQVSPRNPNDPIQLSDEAILSIKGVTKQKIDPLFQEVIAQGREEARVTKALSK